MLVFRLPGATLALVLASASWSATTGEPGANHVDVTTRSPYEAVRGVKLWSYDQRICRLDLAVTSSSGEGASEVEGDKACEPQMSESWKAVDVGAGNFIVAIQACTDADKQQLEGLRAWGAHPAEHGSLGKPGNAAELQLPGCKTWHARVSCASGSIATGVRGFYAGDKHGISGLALRCSPLAPGR